MSHLNSPKIAHNIAKETFRDHIFTYPNQVVQLFYRIGGMCLTKWMILVVFVVVMMAIYIRTLIKKRRKYNSDWNEKNIDRMMFRFRRRDRFAFYMKKVVRKIKSEIKDKKERVERLTQPVSINNDSGFNYLKYSPMGGYKFKKKDSMLPDELRLLYNSLKVYGLFDPDLLLDLCQTMTKLSYNAGEFIFEIGKIDVGFIVVVSGEININMKTKSGKKVLIRKLTKNDTIHSTLHIFEQFMKMDVSELNIEAKVVAPTTIYRISSDRFCEIISKEVNFKLKLSQMVMFRYQQVTLTVMRELFGLTKELTTRKSKLTTSKLVSTAPRTAPGINYEGYYESSQTQMVDPSLTQTIKNIGTIFGTNEFDNILISKGKFISFDGKSDLLSSENKPSKPCLYFIVEGSVNVGLKNKLNNKTETIIHCSHGEFVGIVDVLIGAAPMYVYECNRNSKLFMIPFAAFKKIAAKKPDIVCMLAQQFIKTISKFIKSVDFVIHWTMYRSGEPIFLQDDKAEYVYLILNGRVTATKALRTRDNSTDKNVKVVREYGRHDVIGLVPSLQNKCHSFTIQTVRDTEVGIIPVALLNASKSIYNSVMENISNILSNVLLQSHEENSLPSSGNPRSFSTFAIIPASENVPFDNFCYELFLAMEYLGNTCLMSRKSYEKIFSEGVQTKNILQSNFISQMELIYENILFKADYEYTSWTKICLRQADVVLIVALASEEPNKTNFLKKVENSKSCLVQKHLILLHEAERYRTKSITRSWLSTLQPMSAHFHIRLSNKYFNKKISIEKLYKQHREYINFPSKTSDICRLARTLTGNAIGLCLGGGGARGISHLGVIKSLEDHGIPIDMVGGTSMGSFVGAAYAINADLSQTIKLTNKVSQELSKILYYVLDFTLPLVSLFTGKYFNEAIRHPFNNINIEDLILPYFCVSVDLTDVNKREHHSGILWKYVRASMSLPTYMPPLCDPVDGHLLVDGGFINNLPADIMREKGASIVLAVDVSSRDTNNFTNYGETLSGWRVLLGKIFPFVSPINVPNMSEIQSRLAYVCFHAQQNLVKNLDNTIYLRPPIEKYSTLQFGDFTEIFDKGYTYMNEVLGTNHDTYRQHKAIFQKLIDKDSFHKKIIKRMMQKEAASALRKIHPFKDLHSTPSNLGRQPAYRRKRSRSYNSMHSEAIRVFHSREDPGYISDSILM